MAPLFAWALKFRSVYNIGAESLPAYLLFFPLIYLGALLFGATFPLISHVSIPADQKAGASLSYLYAANIVGSTLGSFAVGFILMNYFSLWQISSTLLVLGLLFSMWVLHTAGTPAPRLKSIAAMGLVATVLFVTLCHPVFATIYDRLLFKSDYPRQHFSRMAETRSGVVGETPNGIVFGGGVYDGRYNVDLFHDVNMILRPYAISAVHSSPRRVLMIGLGSGSWTQAVVANPDVEDVTVVEINPAYLQLIPEHFEVASILKNPKVKIVIDDGRRWLLRNRESKFDVIVMNTTFNWRDHSSNLLSADFLRIVRQHLNVGGLCLYNPTESNRVIATGMAIFPFTIRVENALIVSDSPLIFDRERWKAALQNYALDGRRLIDPSDQNQVKALHGILNLPDDPTGTHGISIEKNDELRHRLQGFALVTDDNMGSEWER
jgi:predicted membrane-bound spermidine synthase